MNRQNLINRLVTRKLQPAGHGKNLYIVAKVFCVCWGGPAQAPRQQTPAANLKS